ncbi:MAG: tRNA pseudouridine(38-40) synthase TruA [Acidobacteria bacterium]|nr:tRNA pseudouridine(38-40) synthase TruA [Acidobacteriota bacterium]
MQDGKSGDKTRKPIERQNIRLTVAFEGTAYHGWQIQSDSATLQGVLSEAIRKITGEQVKLTGSGRTDAGTHARGLVANFSTGSAMAPARLARGLNAVLPHDIRVLSAKRTHPGFHARKDASSKIYRYQIYLGPVLPPHLRREYLHYPYRVDVSRMQAAARLFSGEHDFASFAKTNADRTNTVRRIFRCDLKKKGHILHLTVEGNGFLHHMVRNMAGTLLEVGKGSMSLEAFKNLFKQKDRRLAGFTAPAHGLVLLKVRY